MRPIRPSSHRSTPKPGQNRVFKSPNQLSPRMLWGEQRLAEIPERTPTVERSNALVGVLQFVGNGGGSGLYGTTQSADLLDDGTSQEGATTPNSSGMVTDFTNFTVRAAAKVASASNVTLVDSLQTDPDSQVQGFALSVFDNGEVSLSYTYFNTALGGYRSASVGSPSLVPSHVGSWIVYEVDREWNGSNMVTTFAYSDDDGATWNSLGSVTGATVERSLGSPDEWRAGPRSSGLWPDYNLRIVEFLTAGDGLAWRFCADDATIGDTGADTFGDPFTGVTWTLNDAVIV